jgi:phenylpropionate dioxygenase-like ring-hydroxylating dioxygenase large terminal subunit
MDVASLVEDRPREGEFRVHRSTMTSPEIFAAEQQRILERCWLYVAHESELPHPGDYRRRTLAGRSLFVLRGDDGAVRAFYNTCTHRGAQVCRQDSGTASQFQCFYHAWTFNTRGELIGVPGRDGYAASFDPSRYTLRSPPRFEAYRGMYFVNFDPAADDLATYLGEARELVDLTMDAGDSLGGWQITAGTSRFSIRGNWKLMVENSLDNYHFAPVHQTYVDYMARRKAGVGVGAESREAARARTTARALSGRHSVMTFPTPGRTIAYPTRAWSDDAYRAVEQLRAQLVERHGEARGREMAEMSRLMSIFPTLIFQDTHSGFRLRQILPTAPDAMDILQWDLVPRQERDDLRAYRTELSLAFLGPGGFGTPDDVEAIESCQLGYRIPDVEWSDLSRGMHRAPRDDDELGVRTFWRQWLALMQGERYAPLVAEYAGAEAVARRAG